MKEIFKCIDVVKMLSYDVLCWPMWIAKHTYFKEEKEDNSFNFTSLLFPQCPLFDCPLFQTMVHCSQLLSSLYCFCRRTYISCSAVCLLILLLMCKSMFSMIVIKEAIVIQVLLLFAVKTHPICVLKTIMTICIGYFFWRPPQHSHHYHLCHLYLCLCP